MDGYTGKCRENAGERPQKGRRNVDGGTGECRTGLDTLGAEVIEKVDSCEKSVPERKEGKNKDHIGKGNPERKEGR
ncbi:hypothetical protein [Sphingobacterium sp. GVS05A]|uniref:hypothetical protein n=1 Tax=Sphingobacterium sp. GVS05A TaxID=2862679 RepID=UPI001CBFBA33|nr:hypothetical protein [Sphingobacterium sp. GVS05A]